MADSEIDIAQRAQRISELARDRLGIADEHLIPYGHHMAKIALPHAMSLMADPGRRDGRLVLVTAISPTPAGEGKTTTSIGLADALNSIGRKAMLALREPSMGPVFGIKGGATGGGRAQLTPMEAINLHFTGDFAAVGQAHNLLAALIDNHVHHGNALDIDPRRVAWRRVMDMNDRALRRITVGLGGPANGWPREDGFDIVAASEVMAILCLASSLADLRARLARIVVAETRDRRLVTAADLKAVGAMAVLLRDALAPNLVQTLEHSPALLHGGPFGNIAHGCNSVIATRTALRLADYVVTEAGFGADLGAEKFIDIKCRAAGLAPACAVLVATVRALKFHGGVEVGALAAPDPAALARGLVNLERHLHNLREVYGLRCVVAINAFDSDTEDEHGLIRERLQALGVEAHAARHYSEGGRGAVDLARAVVDLCDAPTPARPGGDASAAPRLLYDDALPLWDKLRAVARRIYGADDVVGSAAVRAQAERLQRGGHGLLPVCVAKTQYSFSTDATLRGAPTGHVLDVRELRLAAGAGFVVAICGEMMTMPGLPKVPASERMSVDNEGRIQGLS
ncbi:MAG: formate--tetrahydrofolate ligase [Burkholderiales bacterium]|nr:formate--tetrahydrofolate ligase [Burkholderiales bacterium]